MADTKISALPAVAAGATTQEIPVNDGGTSRKLTLAQVFSLLATVALTRLDVDNLRLDGNTLSSTSGNVVVSSAGTVSFSNTALEGIAGLKSNIATFWLRDNIDVRLGSGIVLVWCSGTAESGADFGVSRQAAGVGKITDGSSGLGRLWANLRLTKTSSTSAASLTEYPNDGDFGVHHNTALGTRHVAFNDGGTLFTVALT
jgi:hypothetical protein